MSISPASKIKSQTELNLCYCLLKRTAKVEKHDPLGNYFSEEGTGKRHFDRIKKELELDFI